MTATQPHIAVIMPAYNAEASVGAAIDSVVTQDYDHLTLIVIDDASTDGTLRQIRSHLSPRPAAIVIEAPHGGYANALRHGFEAAAMAKADYVICCDADDIMLPGAISALAAQAAATRADIVFAPYISRRSGRPSRTVRPRTGIGSLNDMPIDTAHFALWNKLIRTAVIDRRSLPFADIDRWADLAVVAGAMAGATRISSIDTPVYAYFENPGTLSRSSKLQLLTDHMALATQMEQWLANRNLQAKYAPFITLLKFCAKIKLARNPGRDLHAWAATYPEVNSHIMRLHLIPLHYRLLFRAALAYTKLTP